MGLRYYSVLVSIYRRERAAEEISDRDWWGKPIKGSEKKDGWWSKRRKRLNGGHNAGASIDKGWWKKRRSKVETNDDRNHGHWWSRVWMRRDVIADSKSVSTGGMGFKNKRRGSHGLIHAHVDKRVFLDIP